LIDLFISDWNVQNVTMPNLVPARPHGHLFFISCGSFKISFYFSLMK